MKPLPTPEIVERAAVDSIFFGEVFFPQTFRQPSPPFHQKLFSDLDNPHARYVAFLVFRGAAKTSILRVFTAKRIAYGISRTILFVGSSQTHATRSVRWIRKQIESNRRFADTFQLRRGGKWTDEVLEIENRAAKTVITVIALGITGDIRGVNVDDRRPDLIVVDDPLNDENALTEEQRDKIKRYLHGSLRNSLAPATENPDAKLVVLATPQARDDAVMSLEKSNLWFFQRVSVFDEHGESVWPERFPLKWLTEEKRDFIATGRLGEWLREFECRITDPARATFRREWLQFFDPDNLPQKMAIIGAIDPAPPPPENRTGKITTDFEVLRIVGWAQGNIYILDKAKYRGHLPERTLAEFWRLNDKWHPFKWRIEAVAYQRTLVHLIRRAMDAQHRFVQLDEVIDRRQKAYRIIQALHGIASNRKLFVSPHDTEFIEDFCSFPDCQYFDDLDATAMAIDGLLNEPGMIELLALDDGEGKLAPLPDFRSAP